MAVESHDKWKFRRKMTRSPGEKHTCANIPLHLRQCGEERMTSEDEIPRRSACGISGPPAGVLVTFWDPAAVGPSDLLSVFVIRQKLE